MLRPAANQSIRHEPRLDEHHAERGEDARPQARGPPRAAGTDQEVDIAEGTRAMMRLLRLLRLTRMNKY